MTSRFFQHPATTLTYHLHMTVVVTRLPSHLVLKRRLLLGKVERSFTEREVTSAPLAQGRQEIEFFRQYRGAHGNWQDSGSENAWGK